MNRSILIVICDFLLVSLLAFSTVDINKVGDPQAQRSLSLQLATNRVDSSDKDLAAVMRLALDEERKGHEQLQGRLGERERQLQLFQQQLQEREQETRRLHEEQASLEQQYAVSQTNLQNLSRQLRNTSTEAVLSQEKLATMEAEMRRQTEQAAALQRQMAQLAQSNQTVLNEKQQLAGQLQVAEVEKRAATQQVALMQEVVKAEREEKAKLAEGVKALASKSDELAQEVRENRSLAPNTIFSDFVTNRVAAHFAAYRSTLLGIDSNRRRDTETVLLGDGTNTYALCHVQDTPLVLWSPGTEWDQLTGTLSRNAAQLPIKSLIFSLRDPRIVLMPLSADEARQLGGKVYRLASDPYKFQDAVLVGAREGYYGECRFELDLATPGYVKLDRSFLKGLFGKFNPSSGDLVFTKTGDLLGVMANSSYCMVLQNVEGAAQFRFGTDVRDQHTGTILSQLYAMVAEMPFRLQ